MDEGFSGGGGQELPQDRADAGATVRPGSAPLMLLLGPQVLPHVLHVCEPGVRCADPPAHPQLAPTLQILPLVRLLPVRLRGEGVSARPEAAGPGLSFVEAPSQAGEDGVPVCVPWDACCGTQAAGSCVPGCRVLGFVPRGMQSDLGSRVGVQHS